MRRKERCDFFGEATGNCIYDKGFLERLKTVKGPYEAIEFDESQLYRLESNVKRPRDLSEEEALDGEGEDGSSCFNKKNKVGRGGSKSGRSVLLYRR